MTLKGICDQNRPIWTLGQPIHMPMHICTCNWPLLQECQSCDFQMLDGALELIVRQEIACAGTCIYFLDGRGLWRDADEFFFENGTCVGQGLFTKIRPWWQMAYVRNADVFTSHSSHVYTFSSCCPDTTYIHTCVCSLYIWKLLNSYMYSLRQYIY